MKNIERKNLRKTVLTAALFSAIGLFSQSAASDPVTSVPELISAMNAANAAGGEQTVETGDLPMTSGSAGVKEGVSLTVTGGKWTSAGGGAALYFVNGGSFTVRNADIDGSGNSFGEGYFVYAARNAKSVTTLDSVKFHGFTNDAMTGLLFHAEQSSPELHIVNSEVYDIKDIRYGLISYGNNAHFDQPSLYVLESSDFHDLEGTDSRYVNRNGVLIDAFYGSYYFGGAQNEESSILIRNCRIRDNTAHRTGYIVSAWNVGAVSIVNSSVTGNHASESGLAAVIYVRSDKEAKLQITADSDGKTEISGNDGTAVMVTGTETGTLNISAAARESFDKSETGFVRIDDTVVNGAATLNVNINKPLENQPDTGEVQLNGSVVDSDVNLYGGMLSLLGNENVFRGEESSAGVWEYPSRLHVAEGGSSEPILNTVNGKIQNFRLGGMSAERDAELRLDVDLSASNADHAPLEGCVVGDVDNFNLEETPSGASDPGAAGAGQLRVGYWNVTGIDESREKIPVYVTDTESLKPLFGLSSAESATRVAGEVYFYGVSQDAADKGVYWFVRADKIAEDTPDPDTPAGPDTPPAPPAGPVYTPPAEAVLSLAGLGNQSMISLGLLSDLRTRLGEVRRSRADGLWAQFASHKDHISGFESTGFKQTLRRLSFGFDRMTEKGWLFGANLKASEGKQTAEKGFFKATGDSASAGFNVYGTWIGENGWYGDIVFSADRFSQDIDTYRYQGGAAKGTSRNWGAGLSAEAGRKIYANGSKRCFVEPQAQLSWYHVSGDDFSVGGTVRVHQSGFDSLTGRLGAVAGYERAWGENGNLLQITAKAGLKHEFAGNERVSINGFRFKDDISGTRFYYGAGIDWEAKKNLKFYASAEREKGGHYTKDYEARIGAKWSF